MEIVDIFCHFLPSKFFDTVKKITDKPIHMLERAFSIPAMTDIQTRIKIVKCFEGYFQIPSLVSPPIEYFAGPNKSPDLAKIANDEMAELVEKNRNIFTGFVASLPMNNIDAAMLEVNRSIKELGAFGVQIFTNVNGKPLDDPCFLPLFDLIERLNIPVWLHPTRSMMTPDYTNEKFSRYELWWALGWPYETSLAMYRLVFSGIFERFPKIKIITHHCGGMIPMVEGRLESGMKLYGTRTPKNYKYLVKNNLKGQPLEAFKYFYADTATFGSKAAIECGLNFFGEDRLLFGTDMPFDPEHGPGYIRATLKALDEMNISTVAKKKILSENFRKLFFKIPE